MTRVLGSGDAWRTNGQVISSFFVCVSRLHVQLGAQRDVLLFFSFRNVFFLLPAWHRPTRDLVGLFGAQDLRCFCPESS